MSEVLVLCRHNGVPAWSAYDPSQGTLRVLYQAGLSPFGFRRNDDGQLEAIGWKRIGSPKPERHTQCTDT